MKRLIAIAIIVLIMVGLFAANGVRLLACSASAADSAALARETMEAAQQLYESGQYAPAAQAYEQLVAQGYADSALFYNLGNAYYKAGDYGRAILNYRRAQRLAPRDPDIEANLALARSRTVDRFEAVPAGNLLEQVGLAVRGWISFDQLALAVLAAWMLFMFLLILRLGVRPGSRWRQGWRYALAVAGVVLVVGLLATGSYLYAAGRPAGGVVVVSQVDVTSGPGSHYVTEFTLHSGAEVSLLEERGNWVRLALPGQDLEGWVPASTVEDVAGDASGL